MAISMPSPLMRDAISGNQHAIPSTARSGTRLQHGERLVDVVKADEANTDLGDREGGKHRRKLRKSTSDAHLCGGK